MSSEAASYRLKLFQHYQERLVSFLKEFDLLKLSSDLLEYKVISKDVQDKFASLDQDYLRPDRRVRYLLQQVHLRIREVDKVYDRLVRVLSKVGGGMKDVCEAMRKEQEGIERGKANGTEKAGGVHLTDKDVPVLIELMISGNFKWEEIGIALGLPEYVREECRNGRTNLCKLTNILTAWISGRYNGTKEVTLGSLKKALASEMVGLYDVAQKVVTFEKSPEASAVVTKEYLGTSLEINYQSYDTEVGDGRSTVLEVQVNGNGCEWYQWSKDGQPLLEGTKFSGVSTNLLYINSARQDTEGKYSCCVNNDHETRYSDEISLMVIYPPEKEILMKLYSVVEKERALYSWPPVYISTFVNLVLIKQEYIRRSYSYPRRGDMDDIVRKKEVIEYEEIFRNYREGALVLVVGRPGSGKTTLVRKVSKDWAINGKVLEGVSMVFRISLRLLSSSKRDKTLLDILEIFYEDEYVRKNIEGKLKKCGGKGACFIMDGLDEYRVEGEEESVIYQLIYKKCLPFSMVIVASRPVATAEIWGRSTFIVEVLGFTKQQIYEYVEAYPFSVPEFSFKLKVFLDDHVNVLHMCYLPVHAAMICYLFSQLEGDIPHTETQIYEQFTISTLLRQKKRMGKQVQIRSLKGLNREDKDIFDKICKLAFEMTIESQQVLSKSDALACLSVGSDLDGLGLLTVERTSRHYGIEDIYSFLHLTFQEYLTAFYLAELEKEKQIEFFEKCARTHMMRKMDMVVRLKNVWKFYFGLVDFSKNSVLMSPLFDLVRRSFVKIDPFFNIQCAFESQQATVCDYVASSVLFICNKHLISSDFASLGYVISTVSHPVTKLEFSGCMLDKDGILAFSSAVSRQKLQCIKYLVFSSWEFNGEVVEALKSLLGVLLSLEELNLEKTKFNKSSVERLTRNTTLSQLKILKINLLLESCFQPMEVLRLLTFNSHVVEQVYFYGDDDDFIYDFDERLLTIDYAMWRKWFSYAFGIQEYSENDISWMHLYNSDFFSSFNQEKLTYCTEIIFVNCSIADEEIEILANRLNTSVIEYFVLDFNRVSDYGAVALAGCIAKCSVVKEVSIQCNFIGDSGAIALADALVRCSSLRRLDLQGNMLGDEGAVAIAKAAKDLPKVIIYICNANITVEGIMKVLELKPGARIRGMVFGQSWEAIKRASIEDQRMALKCGMLPALELSDINISNMQILINELDHLKNIRGLICKCGEDTIPATCMIMKSMDNLQEIRFYKLTSKEVKYFSDSLKNCKYLCSICINGIFKPDAPISSSLLVDGLTYLRNLKSLELIYCYIGSDGVASLFHDHSAWINLEVLNLRGNNIGSSGIQVLSKVLMHCKVLYHLDLTSNDIDDNGAVILAEGMKNTTSLQELRLGSNQINTNGLVALIPVINANHLQIVDLTWCFKGPQVVSALVTALCGVTLQKLMFHGNNLGSDGAASLGAGLKHCTHLVELSICNNCIGSQGAIFLTEGLQSCRQLVKLNLSNNNICSSGMSSLSKVLQYCTNLRVLLLDWNKIASDGVAALVDVLESCSDLQFIDLSGNTHSGVDDLIALVHGWHHKSLLQLKFTLSRHRHFMKQGQGCCSSCYHLLELYNSNDYVIIHDLPKIVSAKWKSK